MWTESAVGQQLIGEISKELVTQIAPEEMDMFDELLQDHFENPASPTATDDPLGFGAEIMVAVTPVIAGIMGIVIQFLLDEVIKAAKQESSTAIAQKVRAILNLSPQKNDESLELTKAQLAQTEEIVRTTAIRRGMAATEASELALIVVGRISLSK
jgi:hypothetical protein